MVNGIQNAAEAVAAMELQVAAALSLAGDSPEGSLQWSSSSGLEGERMQEREQEREQEQEQEQEQWREQVRGWGWQQQQQQQDQDQDQDHDQGCEQQQEQEQNQEQQGQQEELRTPSMGTPSMAPDRAAARPAGVDSSGSTEIDWGSTAINWGTQTQPVQQAAPRERATPRSPPPLYQSPEARPAVEDE
jgi:hypothetical protein